MTNELDPIAIAGHWPFLERNLVLDRWPAGRRALVILARAQMDHEGAAVALGPSRLRAEGLTRGEAGNVWRALVELEERGVVARLKGRGRRPGLWTLRGDIGHWRRMPWTGGISSGRRVARAIEGCFCRADCAVVARFPGQRRALSRGWPEIALSGADHLWRPGLFLVETRDNGARRATTAQSRAWEPVETRDNGAVRGDFLLSLEEDIRLLHAKSEEEEGHRLIGAVGAATRRPVVGSMRARLNAVGATVGERQELLATELARIDGMGVGALVQYAEDWARRPEPMGSTRPPLAVERLLEEIDRLRANVREQHMAGIEDLLTQRHLSDALGRLREQGYASEPSLA